MNKQKLIGLLIVLVFVMIVLVSPSANGHFDANDWDHNQAHFDTPIDPQPQTQPSTQSTTVVTADQQVVVVPNQTEVVAVKRSFWDSSFWNAVNINVGLANEYGGYMNGYPVYPVYPIYGGCGYNYCGRYHSSHYYKSYRTHYPQPHHNNGGHNNGGHNNGGHNNGGHNNGGHKSTGRTFNRDRN